MRHPAQFVVAFALEGRLQFADLRDDRSELLEHLFVWVASDGVVEAFDHSEFGSPIGGASIFPVQIACCRKRTPCACGFAHASRHFTTRRGQVIVRRDTKCAKAPRLYFRNWSLRRKGMSRKDAKTPGEETFAPLRDTFHPVQASTNALSSSVR
jgi:hypothetical protein